MPEMVGEFHLVKKLAKLFLTMQYLVLNQMNQLCLMWSSANAQAFVKEHTLLKTALQYQVVDANHGVKKELDVLVKVLSALHNDVELVRRRFHHHAIVESG